MSHLKAWRGTGTVRRTIWAGGCETSLSQGDSFSRRREQEQYKSMPRKKRKFSRRYQASTRTEEHHPGSIGLAGVNSGSQYAKALSCADRNVARRSANPFLSARLTSYPNRKSHAAHNAHQSCELCVYRWSAMLSDLFSSSCIRLASALSALSFPLASHERREALALF